LAKSGVANEFCAARYGLFVAIIAKYVPNAIALIRLGLTSLFLYGKILSQVF
jgi:hypothetical protein